MDNKQETFSDIIRREASMAKETANAHLRSWMQDQIRKAIRTNKNYIHISNNPKLNDWEYSTGEMNELIDWLKVEGFKAEYRPYTLGWTISW